MKRILIINDCKFESIIMKDCLMDIGYDVEVTSEYDALFRVKEFQPDIVIANLIMKYTTGDKLIKKIKKGEPEIICLLSSCDQIKLGQFEESNVNEVINTPVSREQLIEIINRSLSKQEKKKLYSKSADEVINRLINKVPNKKNVLPDSDVCKNKFSFCPYCGQKLDTAQGAFLYCPYCGQKLEN